MIEQIFWKKQDILKDYKINKFKLNLHAMLITIIPFGVFYGLKYESLIRKIPFSLQAMTLLLFYQMIRKILLDFRYSNRRINKYIKKAMY